MRVSESRFELRRRGSAWAIALLVLAGCNDLIGLRDDYYVSETAGGFGAAGGAGGAAGIAGTAGGGQQGTPDAGSDGGVASGPRCADRPLTAESGWILSASPAYPTNPPSALVDHMKDRWSTGAPQVGNEWLQVDFGQTVNLRRINFQQGTMNSNDYPRQYAVTVSDTPFDLSASAVKTGFGMSGTSTTIVLPAVESGRYLLVKQTDNSLSWWSAEELEVSCFED